MGSTQPHDPGADDAQRALDHLARAGRDLAQARDVRSVGEIVGHAARALAGADGATFVLREGDLCHYVDEDAIAPLWKDRRFPMEDCVSGYCMMRGEPAVIEDVYADPRVPIDAYRPTFVKSLAMLPIRSAAPLGAIGSYWSSTHRATSRELSLLQALADLSALAIENARLRAALRDADGEQERFASFAAYALREPLTPAQLHVEGLARLLARGAKAESPGLLARANAALRSVERVAASVERLLDATVSPDEPLDLRREDTELRALLSGLVARLAAPLRAAGCTIVVDAPQPVTGRWDPARLEQALASLLAHASWRGAGRPIRIAARALEDRALVEVRDDGPPSSFEEAARVFDRFRQPETAGRPDGLGLGPWHARRVARAHGGEITIEAAPGRGTTLSIVLPLDGGEPGRVPDARR